MAPPTALDRYLGAPEQTGDVRLLVDGGASFAAREALVRGATDRVAITQLYWPVGAATARMLAILGVRAEDGVDVRLLIDRLSSHRSERPWLLAFDRYVRRIRPGSPVVRFFSVPDGRTRGRIDVLHFAHAKIIVVDGERGITGGANHSDVYAARGRLPGEPGPLTDREVAALKAMLPDLYPRLAAVYGARLERPDLPASLGWRDTDIEVAGPPARRLERHFDRKWDLATRARDTTAGEWLSGFGVPSAGWSRGPAPATGPYRPRPPEPRFEGVRVRVVDQIPWLGEAYDAHQTRWLLATAREYVVCHIPYLVLPIVVRQWLAGAARRGVKVAVLTNGPAAQDLHRAVSWAARARYAWLMRRGVRIYEWIQPTLHSKVCLADDEIAIVGSNNRDYLAHLLASELSVTVIDRPFARHVKAMMKVDLAQSRRITPKEAIAWRKRVAGPSDFGGDDWGPIWLGRALDQLAPPFVEGHLSRPDFLSPDP